MKTYRIAPIVAALLSTAQAHDLSDHWDADYYETGCFATINASTDILVHEQPRLREDIRLTFVIGKAHPNQPNLFPRVSEIEPDSMTLYTQVVLGSDLLDAGVQVSGVFVESGDDRYHLIRNPESESQSFPSFLAGGESANNLWRSVSSGHPTTYNLRINDSENVSIPIPTSNIQVVSAMLEACVRISSKRVTDDN